MTGPAKKPLWARGGGNWRTLTKVKIPCSNTVSLAYGEVNIVLREPIDTWQAHWPCFSMYTFGNVNEQSLPRSPLLGYSSMTISGSFPWSGFQNHVHFSTRLLVTHFNMASVPTGTEVSVGISTKLTLAGTRNKMNLTIDLIFWFFFFFFIFQEILDEEQWRRERYFFLDSKRIFSRPPSLYL